MFSILLAVSYIVLSPIHLGLAYNFLSSSPDIQTSCPDSDTVIIFGTNFQPKEYLLSNLPIIFCHPFVNCYIDNVLILDPVFSCVPKEAFSQDCPCPDIQFIDEEGIRELPYSEYLGNRSTSKPIFSVSDGCVVTVNPSNFSEFDDFFFIIFRLGAPPIFSKRFSPRVSKVTFIPDGLSCSSIGDGYEWAYFGGILENISFSYLSNEEKCGCGEFPKSIPTVNCDIFELKCPEPTNAIYLSDQEIGWNLVLPNLGNETIFDAICINGSWYYNGMKLSADADIICNEPVSILDLTSTTYNYTCGCRELMQITGDNELMMVYDMEGLFIDFEILSGKVDYSDGCNPVISCEDSDYLVFFSRNFRPMMYYPDQLPNVICQKSPLAVRNTNSGRFWMTDGIMLSEAAFACLTHLEERTFNRIDEIKLF